MPDDDKEQLEKFTWNSDDVEWEFDPTTKGKPIASREDLEEARDKLRKGKVEK